jgi:hypothetical protein
VVLVVQPTLIKLAGQILYLAISPLLAAALVVMMAAMKQVAAAVAAVAVQPTTFTTFFIRVLNLALPITVVMALRGKVMLVAPQQ